MEPRNLTLLSILTGATLAVTLVLSAFIAFVLTRPDPSADVTAMRQITVVGLGEAKVAPDTAKIQIGIETNAPTAEEALAQNSTRTQTVIDQIKASGIEEKDIQTSSFGVSAHYDDESRTITHYTVTDTVIVTVRDVRQTGDLLDRAVQAGANRIYGITFEIGDTQALEVQTRDKAMADARSRAEQYARASGATLGSVLAMTENPIGIDQVFRTVNWGLSAGAASPSMSVPVQPGEQSVVARIEVTYELR